MKSAARKALGTSRASAAVRYRITPVDPKGHLFEVVCEVPEPAPAGQCFALPAWIPGSYMIREFARHIVAIAAECDGQAVELQKRDKHTWQAAPCDGPLRVRYRVHAWDASVRAAHLDETHGFFNGTSVFLSVAGHEDAPHEVDLRPPTGRAYRAWRVATTLPEHGAARHGFGLYRAADYDALIDHPVEMGTFRLETFEAEGVTHEIVYTGAVPKLDADRVNVDLARLCAAQIRFFGAPPEGGGAREAMAPFDRYVFLTSVAGEGYGGLEHRASTALLTSRDALPAPGDATSAEGNSTYLTFLGLASHEYFHSWNVKRIKPAAFARYDLARENYSSLLWIFEGFTSYYDDLFLVRTGLATPQQYFGLLAKTIDDVMAGPGRLAQSIADSSFDAWIKYYRPDENTPNAVASYYKKGSLVALCLDLHIRDRSRGRASLDDAMRLLWTRYGRDFYDGRRTGLGEDAFPALVEEATGIDVRDEVERWAYGTDELPLAALLSRAGLALGSSGGSKAALGARLSVVDGETRLATVYTGGAAHQAGLSAGDALIAIEGLRVPPGKAATMLARYRPGDVIEATTFRNDVLMTKRVTLAAAAGNVAITAVDKPSRRAITLCDRWIGRDDRARPRQ